MVMSIGFILDPVAPMEFNKLYQGIILEDGTWKIPTGAVIEMYPTWRSTKINTNTYRISHDIRTNMVTIQIDLRKPDYRYELTIDKDGFTVETLDNEGNPAPCEWKFKLRKNH